MSVTMVRSRDYPMNICEEIFLDKHISLEAKAIIGILNTHEIRGKNINEFLSHFKIDNLNELLNELEINQYYFIYQNTWSDENETYFCANGLKYSYEDKKDVIRRAVINYIEIQENNNRIEYSDNQKKEMTDKALSTFIKQEEIKK